MESSCKHKGECSTCPYEYCIDEEKEQKVWGDRTEYQRQYHKENREKVNEKHRSAYYLKKQNGICVRCDKKATHGAYCYEHMIQQKIRSWERSQIRKRQRHERGLVPEKRKKNGLCLWCGEKATGGTLACDRHRKVFAECSKKNTDTYWKRLNDLIFKTGTENDGEVQGLRKSLERK